MAVNIHTNSLDGKIILTISEPVTLLVFTPDELRNFIVNLQKVLDQLPVVKGSH